ncbi:MAG: PD40 domain-containing protein [Candidatus Eremiobacteraeota bacterium]|nr:PD40 domain-containing protein [Candidatus Eremiobacteraeota bacterium]
MLSTPAAARASQCGPPVSTSPFLSDGYMVAWNHQLDRVAYAKRGATGLFELHLIKLDGTGDVRLGADNPQMPSGNTGSPGWRPDGSWLAFSAEKSKHPGSHADAIPGFGGYSDIWVATPDGARLYRLTEEPNDSSHGVIIPRFSPDGRKLAWTARVRSPQFLSAKRAMGYWVLRVADFVVDANGVPSVRNIRDYRANGDAFYEMGGFSPDSRSIVFTSDYATGKWWLNQIYSIDLETSRVVALTSGDYNEHPSYTPDGRITWMSDRDVKPRLNALMPGTDWWVMDADGSHKQRLTYLNTPGHPESSAKAVWAGTVTWSSDGSRFIGDVQTDLFSQSGEAIWVTLSCPSALAAPTT